jgi:hypothetical protein
MGWFQADMYGPSGAADQHVSTAEQVSQEGPIVRGSSLSWLAVVGLLVLVRIIYEVGQ